MKYISGRCNKAILVASCAISTFAMTPARAQSASDGVQLGEVVVTAQKKQESLIDVPSAVSVVSPKLLSDLHATQLADISAYVPAFQVNSGGSPGQTTISIRGIAPIGRGSTVATYIDDAPVGSSSSYGGGNAFQLDLLPYDIERVEVLRGPQGTLYGASSMGGLLKYVLSAPSLEQMHVQAGADLFGVKSGGGVGGGGRVKVSGPIIPEKLGFVASYAIEDTPGYIDNAVTGQKNQNAVQQQSARLGLYWEPVDRLAVRLNTLYQRTQADGNASIALDADAQHRLYGKLEDNNLLDQPFSKTIKFVSGLVEYKGQGFNVVSSTSYSDTHTSQTQDASYSYGAAFPFFGLPAGKSAYSYRLGLKKFTQEVRVESSGLSRLQWLVGGFYTHEDSSNFQSPSALTMDGAPIEGVDPLFVGHLPSTYKEYATFGNLNYSITNKFEIFGGLRYSRNHQVYSEIGAGSIIDPIDLENQKSKEGVTTYSAGARYKPDANTTIYFRAASGYRPGGPNLSLPGVPATFASDTLTNYELGVKSQLADKRVLIDAAVFRIDWSDIQLLTSNGGAGFNYMVNGGSARSQGLEANVAVRPIDGLELDATFAYVHSVLTQDVPAIGGLDGDRLPNVPRVSGSLGASYSRYLHDDWKGTLGAGLRLVGEIYSDVPHADDSRRLPGYAALDLNASASNGRYTFRLFAKNVTNTLAYSSYNLLNNQATGEVTQIGATIIQPRTIGAAVDVNF